MKPTRLLIALSALLVLGLLPPLAADEHGESGYYPTEWVTVGEGQDDFTFAGGDPELSVIGHELGADLSNGSIRMLDAETLEFRIELHKLPANGGTPEAIRYTWDFHVADVDGDLQEAQLDGKWTNFSRGTCDPTSGQCAPPEAMPRNPGLQPFLFRANLQQACLGTDATGSCTGLNFSGYDDLAVIQADFNPAGDGADIPATITIEVPIDLFNQIEGVQLDHCSEILPRPGLFGGMIESMPAAFISSSAFPHDEVQPAFGGDRGVYTLPHAEDATHDCDGLDLQQ